ncbi:tryptophan halogenase family protein [Shewanella sp. 10N.286.45.A1]|uniref:tryptophan halogenase family protein n=1 Tax=Shewanella sp. 10N.286.45.A1 TaxID=3229694 RepID=UPI00355188D1
MTSRVQNVVILGGGSAGWMAAACLSKTLGSQLQITLIESESIGTVGVGEATIPSIHLFNQLIGIDEQAFVKATHATFKLGIQFKGWGKEQDDYMHAFGGFGFPFGSQPFFQYWMHSKTLGNQFSFWDYSLNSQAAKYNKFAKIEKVGETNLQGLVYAYQFDASLFASFLRAFSENLGVNRIEGIVKKTNLSSETGFINSLTLDSGMVITGELFIDCSGFKGVLIEQALQTGFECWSHWLPCDSALAIPTKALTPLPPYTTATAHDAGWQWQIPLQHRTGNGYVYSSRYMTDEQAKEELLNKLNSEPIGPAKLIRFKTGMRKLSWNKNCVALGLASGFLEPLESTSIHLVQFSLGKLLKFFPNKTFHPSTTDEFNRLVNQEYNNVRDFIILHYKANQKQESKFWHDCAQMPVPAALQQKISLFEAQGQVHCSSDELFSDISWTQVMLGQNILPKGYHPMTHSFPVKNLKIHLAETRSIIKQILPAVPKHKHFIDLYIDHKQAPNNT